MTTTISSNQSDSVIKKMHSMAWSELPVLIPIVPVIAVSWSLLVATNFGDLSALPIIAMALMMASLGWAFGIVRQAAHRPKSTSAGVLTGRRRHFATAARAGAFGLVVGCAMSVMAFAQIATDSGAPVEIVLAGEIGSGVFLLLAFLVLPAALLRSVGREPGDLSFYELVAGLARAPRVLFYGGCVTGAFFSTGVVFGPIVMGALAPYIAALYVVALEPFRQSH